MHVLERLRRAGAGVVALAGLRVEIFAVELREQFDQWLRVALLAIAVVVLGCVGLGFVAVLITVAFWDSHPLIALGMFALLFLGGAAWCARQLSVLLAMAPEPFAATLAEFRRDGEVLGPRPQAGNDAAPTPPFPDSGDALADRQVPG